MAPSSTRIRSAAMRRRVDSLLGSLTGGTLTGSSLFALADGEDARVPLFDRPHSEEMADRINKVGAVQGVEVKIGDALIDEVQHLLGGDRGGDQLARRRLLVEALETRGKPLRYRGAGARGEIPGLLEILYRENAGHDRDADAGGTHAVEIAKVKAVVEEELGDRARCTGVDLGLEHVDIGGERGTVRVLFRIRGNRDFKVGYALYAGDEVGGVTVAAGMRRVSFVEAAGRVAAQRHDMAHA